jgi:hypothetical protein
MMGFMPFSPEFKEISQQMNESQAIASSLIVFLPVIWNCFAACFIIRYARIEGKKLFTRLLYVMFFVVFFMPQIWGAESADVHGVSWLDMMLIVIPGFLSLLAALPLMMKFFHNRNLAETIDERAKLNFKNTAVKIGLCGLMFAGTYIVFLLCVQMRFEVYCMFYADTAWMQAAQGENFTGILPLFFIPFFRGVTNAFFVLPLLSMITKSKFVFTTAICLIVLAPGVALTVPIPLFPDTVRFLLMASMIGATLLFGIFTGNVLWGKGGGRTSTKRKMFQ